MKRKSSKNPFSSSNRGGVLNENTQKVSLTSTIFSSSSAQLSKRSLTDSLFGSTQSATNTPLPSSSNAKETSSTVHNAVRLFDNSTQQKLQFAVANKRQKNTISFIKSTPLTNHAESPKSEANDPILSNKEKNILLCMRKRRADNEEVKKVLKLINVDLSDIIQDEATSEMVQEDIHGASVVLSHIIRQMGVGTISSSLSTNCSKDESMTLFPPEILDELTTKAKEIQKEICDRLEEVGIKFLESLQKVVINQPNSNNDSSTIFRFHEIASRCRGRLDVRHKTSSPPFTDSNIISNNILLPTVHNLLGNDAELLYTGLIYSFPNSSDQPWHMDGTTLFPELRESQKDHSLVDLPPYALNIFIPLENDITHEIGPTDFFPESHLSSKAIEIDDDLMKLHSINTIKPLNDQNAKDVERIMNRHKVIAPLLKRGDALIYDYRVCHRGTVNLSQQGNTRIMLYLMYARPWFREHLNFGQNRLFPDVKDD